MSTEQVNGEPDDQLTARARPVKRQQAPGSWRRTANILIRWMWASRTLRMFRRDRVLLVGTVVLSASALAPILVTPILPLVDLGSNMGAASLLNDAAFGHGVIAEHYKVNLTLVPYWTVYLLISCLEGLVGVYLTAKIVVALVVVLLPLSVMRMLVAFGRSPRAGLAAFLLTWDVNLYWGWITFQYGMVLALFTIALIYETKKVKQAVRVVPLTLLLGLTHVHAVALTGLAGVLLTFVKRPLKRAFMLHALAMSGFAVTILPWAISAVGKLASKRQPAQFDEHTLRQKVESLFKYTLDVMPTPEGEKVMTIAFLLLVFGSFALMALSSKSRPFSVRWAPVAFLLACLLLYFGLPFAIYGRIEHWWTYPRFGTCLLIGLILVPWPNLKRWGLIAVAVPAIAALYVHAAVRQQFKQYGEYVQPYTEIVASLPKGVRFFPLDLDDYYFQVTREASTGQLHGYAAAVTSSYDPHLFDDPNNPLVVRKRLPVPNWRQQSGFTMADQGRFYDYIIVHPKVKDIFPRRPDELAQLELVREAGNFRLYRVKEPRR